MDETQTSPGTKNTAEYAARQERRKAEILELKGRLGRDVLILTHHYQRPEIVAVGDIRGDSFELARQASRQSAASRIVFCGVHFMAESAAILAQPHQQIFHPNLAAGCPMADMADWEAAHEAWRALDLVLGTERVQPVTYMNSSARIKAFCGEHGGAVCTSSNARETFKWAFAQRPKILFLPDEHLGTNTALQLGIPESEIRVWNPREPCGGLSMPELELARVLVWKGYCHVHTHFTVEDIEAARARYPGCRVVVHPECKKEVVARADAVGSTAFIVRSVEDAPTGSTVVIGTEVNLTSRLAGEHPGKVVVPLARSLCPNMFRINLPNLLRALQTFAPENRVAVPVEVAAGARLALDRMLAIGV